MRHRQIAALLSSVRAQLNILVGEVDGFTTAEPFVRYEEAQERAAGIASKLQTLANDARRKKAKP